MHHIDHSSSGAIAIHPGVSAVAEGFVEKLVEDMIVVFEHGRDTVPELKSTSSACVGIQRHVCLLLIIIAPLEVEDDHGTHASELINHLADHSLVLLGQLGVLGHVCLGGLGLDAEPVACCHRNPDCRLDPIAGDLVEIGFDSIRLIGLEARDDVGGITPVVLSPAWKANTAEEVLSARGAESM